MSIANKEQLEQNLAMVIKMSKPDAKQKADTHEIVNKAKSFFDELMMTNWDSLDITSYWNKMHQNNFKQNLDWKTSEGILSILTRSGCTDSYYQTKIGEIIFNQWRFQYTIIHTIYIHYNKWLMFFF